MKISFVTIFLALIIISGCTDTNINGPVGTFDYKIAYFTNEFDSLHIIGVDGSNDIAIIPFRGKGFSVDWFPDGSSLIFSELITNPLSDTSYVWSYKFRTGQKRLLFSKTMVAVQNLSVSPNGQMVACILYHDNSSAQLSVFDANGGNMRILTPPNQFVFDYQWSPDGSKIVFTLDSNICTIRPDGSQLNHLTEGSDHKNFPSYSPDGTHIVFGYYEDNGLEAISVMNADGSSQHFITPLENKFRAFPKWSPDGKYIIYTQNDTSLISRIFRMDADGKNEMQLSTGTGSHLYPRWVPDGRIVYVSNEGPNLWSVDKYGAYLKQITNIPLELRWEYLTFSISKSFIIY